MRRAFLLPLLVVAAWLQAGALARAQQRPLTTEDPEVIGDGRLLVEAGVETGSNAWYPLSGLHGDRFALPVGVCLGIGRYAELQLDTGYNWLGIDSREDAPLAFRVPADITRTSDIIDVTVATKLRVFAEGRHRPSIGVRFETRLPNASNESGLGLDTTDFFFSILAGKTIGSFRIVGNAGIGILGNPLVATIQSDALSRRPVRRVRRHAGRRRRRRDQGPGGVVRDRPAAWRRATRRSPHRRALHARAAAVRRRRPVWLHETVT